MGCQGLPARGGERSQKRVKNEFKTDFFETFEDVSNSFLTSLPPEAGRPQESILRLFFRIFSHRLKYPSEWPKGSQCKRLSKFHNVGIARSNWKLQVAAPLSTRTKIAVTISSTNVSGLVWLDAMLLGGVVLSQGHFPASCQTTALKRRSLSSVAL